MYNLLETIKFTDKIIKFYQSINSEISGKVNKLTISSSIVFRPLSSYTISKAAAHWICVNYRKLYIWDVNWVDKAALYGRSVNANYKDPRNISDRYVHKYLIKTQSSYEKIIFIFIDKLIKVILKY